MGKSCENCGLYDVGNEGCPNRHVYYYCMRPEPEPKPMAYKITPKQIEWVDQALGVFDTPQSREHWRRQFPDHFKPEQEFCCDVFEVLVSNKDIVTGISCSTSADWLLRMLPEKSNYLDRYQTIKACLNCGQKPKPPIKENQ